jgi:predicted XRE-type DNA-binding protein
MGFKNVFDALADTPAEAANLKARSGLMVAIRRRIAELGWTQSEAAPRLQVTQPRLSDLMTGKIDKFSLDALVNMAAALGLEVEFTVAALSAPVVDDVVAQRAPTRAPAVKAPVKKAAAKKASPRRKVDA